MLPVLILLFASAAAPAQPDAADIMARVAANQDRAVQFRSAYVYRQAVDVKLRRTNHRLAREEHSEYAVTPGPNGVEKNRTAFQGRYEKNGRLLEYSQPHYSYKDVDVDGDVASGIVDDTVNDNSRDGIGKDLFPLTAEQQKKYTFRLLGRETLRARGVYRVAFEPKPGSDESSWRGEAYIDAAEYEPVLVTTKLARGIPFWVRTLLGTNLKQLGFSVAYARFDDGVWFPVSYGGEFEVKAVFVYKRLISLSMANSDFHRADVKTSISYQTGSPAPSGSGTTAAASASSNPH